MDSNQRFDQLESLLVDLARKVDRQGEAIERIEQRTTNIEQRITNIEQRIINIEQHTTNIEQRIINIDDQIGDIINIFKLSEARHTQAEQRLETLTTEVQEQGRRTDEAIQIQMQMLALMRAGNNKTEALEQRFALLESQEPRIKRLEGEVFRTAS